MKILQKGEINDCDKLTDNEQNTLDQVINGDSANEQLKSFPEPHFPIKDIPSMRNYQIGFDLAGYSFYDSCVLTEKRISEFGNKNIPIEIFRTSHRNMGEKISFPSPSVMNVFTKKQSDEDFLTNMVIPPTIKVDFYYKNIHHNFQELKKHLTNFSLQNIVKTWKDLENVYIGASVLNFSDKEDVKRWLNEFPGQYEKAFNDTFQNVEQNPSSKILKWMKTQRENKIKQGSQYKMSSCKILDDLPNLESSENNLLFFFQFFLLNLNVSLSYENFNEVTAFSNFIEMQKKSYIDKNLLLKRYFDLLYKDEKFLKDFFLKLTSIQIESIQFQDNKSIQDHYKKSLESIFQEKNIKRLASFLLYEKTLKPFFLDSVYQYFENFTNAENSNTLTRQLAAISIAYLAQKKQGATFKFVDYTKEIDRRKIEHAIIEDTYLRRIEDLSKPVDPSPDFERFRTSFILLNGRDNNIKDDFLIANAVQSNSFGDIKNIILPPTMAKKMIVGHRLRKILDMYSINPLSTFDLYEKRVSEFKSYVSMKTTFLKDGKCNQGDTSEFEPDFSLNCHYFNDITLNAFQKDSKEVPLLVFMSLILFDFTDWLDVNKWVLWVKSNFVQVVSKKLSSINFENQIPIPIKLNGMDNDIQIFRFLDDLKNENASLEFERILKKIPYSYFIFHFYGMIQKKDPFFINNSTNIRVLNKISKISYSDEFSRQVTDPPENLLLPALELIKETSPDHYKFYKKLGYIFLVANEMFKFPPEYYPKPDDIFIIIQVYFLFCSSIPVDLFLIDFIRKPLKSLSPSMPKGFWENMKSIVDIFLAVEAYENIVEKRNAINQLIEKYKMDKDAMKVLDIAKYLYNPMQIIYEPVLTENIKKAELEADELTKGNSELLKRNLNLQTQIDEYKTKYGDVVNIKKSIEEINEFALSQLKKAKAESDGVFSSFLDPVQMNELNNFFSENIEKLNNFVSGESFFVKEAINVMISFYSHLDEINNKIAVVLSKLEQQEAKSKEIQELKDKNQNQKADLRNQLKHKFDLNSNQQSDLLILTNKEKELKTKLDGQQSTENQLSKDISEYEEMDKEIEELGSDSSFMDLCKLLGLKFDNQTTLEKIHKIKDAVHLLIEEIIQLMRIKAISKHLPFQISNVRASLIRFTLLGN